MVAELEGLRSDRQPVWRADDAYVAVRSGGAALDDVYADHLVDTDADSLAEALEVDVQLTVSTLGTYQIESL